MTKLVMVAMFRKERLHTLSIPIDAVPVARDNGWLVFDECFTDPVPAPVRREQADGYTDSYPDDNGCNQPDDDPA